MGCTNLFDAISHQFSPILASTEFTPRPINGPSFFQDKIEIGEEHIRVSPNFDR